MVSTKYFSWPPSNELNERSVRTEVVFLLIWFNFFRGFLETTADNLWEVELNITTLDKTEILIYKYFKILRSFVLMWAKKISSLGLVWLWVVPLCVIMMVQKIYFDKSQFLIYHAISPFLTPEIKRKEIFTSSASFPCSLSLSKFSIAKTGKLG